MSAENDNTDVELLLKKAILFAKSYQHQYVTLDHLFRSMLEDELFVELLKSKDANLDSILINVTHALQKTPVSTTNVEPIRTPSLLRVFERATSQALASSRNDLTFGDLLWALLCEDKSNPYLLLNNSGVDVENLRDTLASAMRQNSEINKTAKNAVRRNHEASDTKESDGLSPKNDNKNRKAKDVLLEYCTNLTQQARDGKIDTIVGRDNEIEKTFQVLGRRTKPNVIYVGDSGTGKSAIVEGLALRISQGLVPNQLKNCEIYALDTGNLVAGTKFRGDFEERVKVIVEALSNTPNSILFLDEIHTVKGSGTSSDGAMDFANMLKPALAKNKIRVIGCTTIEEFKKYFEKDKALIRRFYRIDVEEPSVAEAKLIVRGSIKHYETFHNVKYTEEAMDKAVDLSVKYIHSRKLPDKAFDILDAAGSTKKLMNVDTTEVPLINTSDIELEITVMAKIPAITLQEEHTDNFANLKENLKKKIFGQDHAIDKIVNYVLVSKAGLRDTEKPLLNVLLTGSTGVGKTELSKQLASELKAQFVRFDMSEYMEEHSISKLIGSPPGYVGYDDGTDGALINAVEQYPNSVLLLDEVEKAHPKVLNILLQIMDYGMLTSSKGKKVSFRNSILILTSNLGAEHNSKHGIGFGAESIAQEMETAAVNEFFKPEFRNRLDAVVNFNTLGKQQLDLVVQKFVKEMNKLVATKNVKITITKRASDFFVEEALKLHMGARPIASLISQHIKEPLSANMLFGELKNGGTVKVDYKKDAIILDFVKTLETINSLEENNA